MPGVAQSANRGNEPSDNADRAGVTVEGKQTEAGTMERYLLILDMDMLAFDAQRDLAPINYLAERGAVQHCEVVVLSLVTDRPRLPSTELLLGARMGKMPVAPRPDHDTAAVAEHRMNLAVQHLRTLGCKASGIISDEDLLSAVRAETRHHDYEQVILMAGRQRAGALSGLLHTDPIHRLRRQLGDRLIIFPSGTVDT